ncbi:MAG: hypothetical protein M1824_002669 [Vezdaea acicularis]|nr:MAG: hypothetical protein M1824_002669 [Vezdaea acicularis]
MSLFPRFPTSEFAPIFRLLDDYDVHRTSRDGGLGGLQSFQPKFDVRELKDSYELHGELPGIDQKDITIEFTDPQTLAIRGRTEREYSSGEQPAQGRITGDVTNKPHQPTVEDETSQNGSTAVTETSKDKHVSKEHPKSKFWVSERSIGEFHRSFGFPTRVDQDAVKANLKNGILHVVVPKAAAHQAKKITIG